MPLDDDTTTTVTDPDIPVDITDQPILWDGNAARILGMLNEVWEHYERNGLYIAYIQKRARVLSNGKLAVDSVSSIPLVMGTVDEPERTLLNLCPPAAARIIEVNAARAAAGDPPITAITSMPPGAADSIIVQPLAVQTEGGKLLGSLHHVFGHAEPSPQLFRDARGDPHALVTALTTLANAATVADTAVVTAEFEAAKTSGINGELSLTKVSEYAVRYERAKLSLTPSSRPQAAAEVELVNLIAFRDASVREAYGLRTVTPPASFQAAIAILKQILTSRLRAEQLDETMSGKATQMGLMAKKEQQLPAPDAPPPPQFDAKSALVAALKEMGVKDPKKLLSTLKKKGKGKEGKVTVPRDKEGKILRWVDGMALCKCGGKHLYRDCDQKESEPTGTAATADLGTAAAADLLQGLASMKKEDLIAQVSALLGAQDKTPPLQGVCVLNETKESKAPCDECDEDSYRL